VELGKLSAKVPVVLVHGLGAWSGYWTRTALRLAKDGRTVLVLDMPGSGGSDKPRSPEGYGLPARVAALSSLVSALGLEKMDLVGHSLGGWTAGLYALAEPHHVRRLVLVDSGGFFTPSVQEAEALRGAVAPRGRADAPSLVDLLFVRPPFPRAGFVTSALARMYEEEGVVETVSRLSAGEVLTGREGALPKGTVLIWGEKDSFLPLADARRAAMKIPGARLVVIPGVGHDPPLEAPSEFERALLAALPKEAE
jgi:abhydrolase domain-containing protein 6